MKQLSDLTAPRQVAKKLKRESEVQESCVKWARGRGYWARKFSSTSQRSVPDYLFAHSGYSQEHPNFVIHGQVKFATEFKREGCKRDPLTGLMSTEAQIEEQKLMRAAGWYVFECSDVETFKRTVLEYERSCI